MGCCQTGNNCFKNVDSFWSTDIFNEVEYNLKYFIENGMLCAGAWIDVTQTGAMCSEDFYTLKPIAYPTGVGLTGELDNKVYCSPRKDWIYETGLSHNGSNPQPVEIYIDGTLQDESDYSVNYPLGQVTLDTANTSNLAVTANYSFKAVQVYLANSSPFWQEIQYNTWSPSKSNRAVQSEIMAIFNKNNVQLPAVMVELEDNIRMEPYQLGSCANWMYIDVKLTVVAEDRAARNKIMAILALQKDKFIAMFDTDEASDDFPLNCDGSVKNNNTYQDVAASNRWKCARISNVRNERFESPCPNFHLGSVIYTLETIDPVKL